MGVNINTNTGYVGEVTLTYITHGKKVKVKKYNKGWSRLFQFIARCLGDSINTDNGRPKFVDIKCQHRGNDGTWESCLFNYIPVTGSVNYFEDATMVNYGGLNYFATMTATISFNMINQAVLGQYLEEDDCALFLMAGAEEGSYSSTYDNPYRMAQLLLDIRSLKDVAPGTQVIIEWDLKFYNREDS